MSPIRNVITIFLHVCFLNFSISHHLHLDSRENIFLDFSKLNAICNSILHIISAMPDGVSHHSRQMCAFDERAVLHGHNIKTRNRDIVRELNFLSRQLHQPLEFYGNYINFTNDDGYEWFGEILQNDLFKIIVFHGESLKLRNSSYEDQGSIRLLTFNDFVTSVLQGCRNVPQILSLTYLKLINTTSKVPIFKQQFLTSLIEKYHNNLIQPLQVYSIYSALIQSEVQGFVTIAHAYWLRQLLGEGTFDNELRQIKDESIKRMKVYLEATQNSIDILIPYKCDNPKHDRFTCDYCQNKAGSWRQRFLKYPNHNGRNNDYHRVSSNELTVYTNNTEDTIVRLSSVPADNDDDESAYQVEIRHRYTRIGKHDEHHGWQEHAEVDTPEILNGGQYCGFRIKWSENNLTVTIVNETTPFIFFSHANIMNIRYLSVFSKWRFGDWIVEGLAQPSNIRWCKASDGNVPPNAFNGELPGNPPVYICRVVSEYGLFPGTLTPSANKFCHAGRYGELNDTNYEVLISSGAEWIIGDGRHERDPYNAVVGGVIWGSRSRPVFICRYKNPDGTINLIKTQKCWGSSLDEDENIEYEMLINSYKQVVINL